MTPEALSNGQNVSQWVQQFIAEPRKVGSGNSPNKIDFVNCGKFVGVEFSKLINEANSLLVRKQVNALLAELFSPQDYHVTGDLTIWFTNQDMALTFKLCNSR